MTRFRRNLQGSRERVWITLFLFCAGMFVTWHAAGYNLGSLRRMGSGYFPLMLGVALCVFSIAIFVSPIVDGDAKQGQNAEAKSSDAQGTVATRLRAIGFILAAMIAFAALIRELGFAPVTALATFIAGLAEPDNSWTDLIALSVFITIFASLVFIVALGVPIPLIAF